MQSNCGSKNLLMTLSDGEVSCIKISALTAVVAPPSPQLPVTAEAGSFPRRYCRNSDVGMGSFRGMKIKQRTSTGKSSHWKEEKNWRAAAADRQTEWDFGLLGKSHRTHGSVMMENARRSTVLMSPNLSAITKLHRQLASGKWSGRQQQKFGFSVVKWEPSSACLSDESGLN